MFNSKIIKSFMISSEESYPVFSKKAFLKYQQHLQSVILNSSMKNFYVSIDPGEIDVVIDKKFYPRIKKWLFVILISVLVTTLLSQPWFTGDLFLLSRSSQNNIFMQWIFSVSLSAIFLASIAIFFTRIKFKWENKSSPYSAYINLELDYINEQILEEGFEIFFRIFEALGFRFQLLGNKLVSFSGSVTVTLEYTKSDIIIPPLGFNNQNFSINENISSYAILIEFLGSQNSVREYWEPLGTWLNSILKNSK